MGYKSTPGPTIIVTGQMAVYSTIILGPLPMEGPFQELVPINSTTLMTEFGPGDVGYLGGRWWIDNLNMGTQGVMDEYDTYFMCPLIGPGVDL